MCTYIYVRTSPSSSFAIYGSERCRGIRERCVEDCKLAVDNGSRSAWLPVSPKIAWQFREENGSRRTRVLREYRVSGNEPLARARACSCDLESPKSSYPSNLERITREPRQTKTSELPSNLSAAVGATGAHKGRSLYYFCFVRGFLLCPLSLSLSLLLASRLIILLRLDNSVIDLPAHKATKNSRRVPGLLSNER